MAHPPGNRNAAADVATARDRRNGGAEARVRPKPPLSCPGRRERGHLAERMETRDPARKSAKAISSGPSCCPWVPALATLGRDTRTVRMVDTLPNRRAEAGARPGHERVAVDAMAFEPLADAPPASFPIHNVKQRSLLRSRGVSAPGSFSFPSSSQLPIPDRGDGGAPVRHPYLLTAPMIAPVHANVSALFSCALLTRPLPSSRNVVHDQDRSWGSL